MKHTREIVIYRVFSATTEIPTSVPFSKEGITEYLDDHKLWPGVAGMEEVDGGEEYVDVKSGRSTEEES